MYFPGFKHSGERQIVTSIFIDWDWAMEIFWKPMKLGNKLFMCTKFYQSIVQQSMNRVKGNASNMGFRRWLSGHYSLCPSDASSVCDSSYIPHLIFTKLPYNDHYHVRQCMYSDFCDFIIFGGVITLCLNLLNMASVLNSYKFIIELYFSIWCSTGT